MSSRGVPVYYGLYNPLTLPFRTLYPIVDGLLPECSNEVGCRVMPTPHVHSVLQRKAEGHAPSVADLEAATPFDSADDRSALGWRLERFVADEVLRCREGKVFDDLADPNLRALLYERSAPIAAAITITIDVGRDR